MKFILIASTGFGGGEGELLYHPALRKDKQAPTWCFIYYLSPHCNLQASISIRLLKRTLLLLPTLLSASNRLCKYPAMAPRSKSQAAVNDGEEGNERWGK